MLLADEPNIREVILFPLNQQGEDLMMGAPAEVPPARLKELPLRLDLPPKPKATAAPTLADAVCPSDTGRWRIAARLLMFAHDRTRSPSCAFLPLSAAVLALCAVRRHSPPMRARPEHGARPPTGRSTR